MYSNAARKAQQEYPFTDQKEPFRPKRRGVHDDVILPAGAVTWQLDDADKRLAALLPWRRACGHKFSRRPLVLRVLHEVEGLVIERGYAFFAVGSLAGDMGLARQTVQDALKVAEDEGAIIIDRAVGSLSRYWPAKAVIESPIIKPTTGRLRKGTCPGSEDEPVRDTRTPPVRVSRTQTQHTPQETQGRKKESQYHSESEVPEELIPSGGEDALSITMESVAHEEEPAEIPMPIHESESSGTAPNESVASPTSESGARDGLITFAQYVGELSKGSDRSPSNWCEKSMAHFRREYDKMVSSYDKAMRYRTRPPSQRRKSG